MAEDSISVKMDAELKRKVRVAAAKSDESMSDWVREAIEEKLERESGNRSRVEPVLAD